MSNSIPASLSVIIIGAGTGGLALAHGLKQAGIAVAVYERDQALHLKGPAGTASASVRLTGRALQGMRATGGL